MGFNKTPLHLGDCVRKLEGRRSSGGPCSASHSKSIPAPRVCRSNNDRGRQLICKLQENQVPTFVFTGFARRLTGTPIIIPSWSGFHLLLDFRSGNTERQQVLKPFLFQFCQYVSFNFYSVDRVLFYCKSWENCISPFYKCGKCFLCFEKVEKCTFASSPIDPPYPTVGSAPPQARSHSQSLPLFN